MAKDIQCEVRNIISEIVDKSADGNYIYRGEPGGYTQPKFNGKVSSSLWRQFQPSSQQNIDDFYFDIVQQAYLKDARRYGGDLYQDDFEFASQLQHTGGKTNLIDFTTDYLVALFFACEGVDDEQGRVILFKLTEDKRRTYKIKTPQNPINRIAAQKSIFVEHQNGFIAEGDIEEIIYIDPCVKGLILTYLRKYHGIYAQTIYNDLQGYIKRQEIYQKAYREYGIAKMYHLHYGSANMLGLNEAIRRYGIAIGLHPDFIEAYYDRGEAYLREGNIHDAIKDFTRVIELDPRYASAYTQRGSAYFMKGCHARASDDLQRAMYLGDNDAHAALNVVHAEMGQNNVR